MIDKSKGIYIYQGDTFIGEDNGWYRLNKIGWNYKASDFHYNCYAKNFNHLEELWEYYRVYYNSEEQLTHLLEREGHSIEIVNADEYVKARLIYKLRKLA